MKKIAIIYASYHHGNTRKIVERVKLRLNIDTYDILLDEIPDLNSYDILGFASGIYGLGLHSKLQKYIKTLEIKNPIDCFIFYTCGSEKLSKPQKFIDLLRAKNFNFLGSEHSLGYDTFGPLKLLGGINKDRPNVQDIEKIIKFIEEIVL